MLRSVRYSLHGAVLAGLLAVPVLWTSVDKSVHLVVDGHRTTVRTTAADVGQVVRAAGYRVTSHDLLAPDSPSSVKDGATIVLRRGRLLNLDVDGRAVAVWTTATTVREALGQLGYTSSDFVSVSRSQRLPLSATTIAIRTPHVVLVVHDGKREQVTTTAATVGSLLADLAITVGAQDRLSTPLSTAVIATSTIVVQRVRKQALTRTVTVPYPTSKRSDSNLDHGTTVVATPGRPGAVRVTYQLIYVDGKLVAATKLRALTLRAPRTQIVKVGTREIIEVPSQARSSAGSTAASSPASSSSSSSSSSVRSAAPTAPAPSAGSAKAIAKAMVAARGWSGAQYDCLVVIWSHESGWRVHASNGSGAYGIPQALPGSKMASAGPDWQNNAETQIRWGLRYVAGHYHDPCGALAFWQAHGWY